MKNLGKVRISMFAMAVATAPMMVAPSAVIAQTAESASESPPADDAGMIVVTARRRNENIQDVPVAVTAVAGEALEQRAITNPSDLMRAAPGLVAGPSSVRGYNQLIFAIRGQRNGDGTSGADPSVGVYFAEAPQNSPQGLNSAFIDLESVAVLRGPQGTLFGRNATAGAVLITPKGPGRDFGGYIRASAGNYGLRDIEGVANIPLSDTLAVRAVGKSTSRNGYMRQVISNIDYDSIDAQSARLSIKWTPSEGIESTTIGTYSRARSTGNSAKLIAVTGAPVTNPTLIGSFLAYQNLGKYEFVDSYEPGAPFSDPSNENRTYSVQNTTSFDLGGPVLKNIISYRNIYDQAAPDGDGTRAQFIQTPLVDRIKEYSEELQLSGTAGIVTYVGGLFLFRADGSEVTDFASLITSPSPIGTPTPASTLSPMTILSSQTRNTSYSAYADATVDLSGVVSGLGISGGLRISRDEREFRAHHIRQLATGSTDYRCLLTGQIVSGTSQCNSTYKTDFTRLTGEFTVNYQASPDNLLYASYRRGYRTGGYSITATNPAIAGLPYQPETVDAFEMGSKNQFDIGGRPATLNLAGYYSEYNDIQRQTTIFTPGVPLFNRVVNAAKAHIYGGEVELDIRPFDALQLLAGYAYTKPVYDSFSDTLVVSGTPYIIDQRGSHFVNISKHQLNLAGTLMLPVPEDIGEISASLNYSYRSKAWQFNELNSPNCTGNGTLPAGVVYVPCYNHNGILPGYGIANFRLDWKNIYNKGIDIGLFVNNITNNYYYSYGVNTLGGNGQGTYYVGVGAPRMFGIEIRASFGSERD
ncbi:TonB-dependent receptor [Sphingobium phenoxybenzoativorans]|uniref:TonB-dependent receptor n=1 Tax=Sphingobium phenoxybenzoativorans TaxID=1592790 RepID=UPI000872606E|nr:TonB-dependent receptor [Sphingobium phenoxybenzoativorans]